MQLISVIFKMNSLELDIRIRKNTDVADMNRLYRLKKERLIQEVLQERSRISQQIGEGRFY